jgi:cellobiose-specific phosphotransferase system component IIB
MPERLLRESVTEAPIKSGNRWKVIVARPGQGSSGFYSEDLFRRDAHKIIAPGGQAFIGHDDDRNIKDLVGVYPEGSRWSEEDNAVVSELEVFSHWKTFVEEVGPHVGVSLYALGESDDEGNVTAFIEDAYNGADLVARPGLVGSGLAEKLYEAAKAQDSKTSTTAVEERKEDNMEIADVVKAVEALADQVSALVAANDQKAEESAQRQADSKAVEAAVTAYDAAVKAIDEADLLKPQVESLRARAARGEDVAEAIAEAKAIKEAAIEATRVTEGATRDFGTRTVESAVDLGKVFG